MDIVFLIFFDSAFRGKGIGLRWVNFLGIKNKRWN